MIRERRSCFAFCRGAFPTGQKSGIRMEASLQFTASVTRLLTAGGTSLLAMHRYAPICRLSTRWNCSTEPLYVSCFSKLPPPAHRENPTLCMFSSRIPSYPLILSFLPIGFFYSFLLDSFPPFRLERSAERDWQVRLGYVRRCWQGFWAIFFFFFDEIFAIGISF